MVAWAREGEEREADGYERCCCRELALETASAERR